MTAPSPQSSIDKTILAQVRAANLEVALAPGELQGSAGLSLTKDRPFTRQERR